MNTWLFTLKEGVLNLRRAPLLTASSVAVMGLSLFVLGIFLLITVNLRAAIIAVQKQVEVVVFLQEGLLEGELASLDDFLKSHPGVSGVEYYSRDQALAKFRSELDEKEYLLEALESNPLPASFEVALFDDWKTTEKIELLVSQTMGMAGVEEVKYGREWVGRLNRAILILMLVDLFLGIVVALSSLLVVANTVKLTLIARKEMIDLMKMVGAAVGVIRRPFVFEGVIQGALAAIFAAILLTMLTGFLQGKVQEVVALRFSLYLLFILFGAALGGIGSLFSMQGFLRRW